MVTDEDGIETTVRYEDAMLDARSTKFITMQADHRGAVPAFQESHKIV